MTFRLKQNLIGVLIVLTAGFGWLIAYQTTQRLARGVDNVARLQQIVDSLEARANRELTDLDRQELRQLPVRLAAARSEVSTQNGALVAYALLTILVLLGAGAMFNRNLTWQERDRESLTAAMQAADAANIAKTRFLATISHEIRTPLNALSGMNQLLLNTRLDSEQMEYARTVHSNAEALSLLIGDLLDSSKIEAGQMDLESLPFDVWELAESVAEILVVRADIKGVELILDIAADVPRSMEGDGNRLRQVLMNLVGNAVKFTEQGEVILRVRSESSGDRPSAMLHFSIIDTGIGIPPEAQRRIFEPFVQADRSTVRRYGGTGLGLNISRSLIQLMGGSLSLESTPGTGSTFDVRLTLPLAGTQPAPVFSPQSLAGIDVLLVDSNASTRETLGRMLTAAGATIRLASTAGEARDVFAAWPAVRVIVIDDSLPDGSALDLVRDTWQTRQDGMPPLGIVPTCSLRSVMTRYVGIYGISSCVYKPAKAARLIEALRHAAGLQAKEPNGDEVDRPAQTRGGPVRPRILLAEDHHDSLVLATRILATAGYDVDLAEDGVKGVELATAFCYDLILMDVEMPRLDGVEATQQIRARERELNQQPVPIVALTAHALEDIRHQTRSAGMDGFMTKPLQRKQLLDVCSQWIDRRPLILVADDAHENHTLLSNLLGTSDYRLVFAFNGREAVTAFERQPISLVVLDIDMPVMNGYDAARTIRRARGGDIVPIVALTGYEGSDERQRCMDAGCTAYLSKALNRANLLSTIHELLGRPSVRGSRSSAPRVQATSVTAGPPTTTAPLPSEREATDHVRGLLARHDFDAIATYAKNLAGIAERLVLSKLATVSEELEDAARRQDEHRAAWWSDQLGPALLEATRLVDVRRHAQSLAGDSYDTLSRLAVTLLGAYCAAITLVDEDGVRIKGSAGLSAPFDEGRSLPFSRSISQHVVNQGTLVVEDARSDPRMRRALAVQEGIISFAAIPITNTQGTTLGAFCALDRRPHRWHAEDVAMLEELASVASWMLNMERRITTVPADGPKPQDATAFPPEPVSAVVTIQDDIVDLVPDYVASRRRDVETLNSHLSRGEFDAAGRLGHKMKGSGAGYGLSELTRIGRELEQAAKLQNAESLRKSIADLSAYLAQLTVRTSDGRVLVQP